MCAAFVGPRERESRTPIRGHVHGRQINNFKGEKPWKPEVMNQPHAAACRLRYQSLAFAPGHPTLREPLGEPLCGRSGIAPRLLPPARCVGAGTARGGRLAIECAEIARDAVNGFEQQRREALGLRVVEA
jgi:hypothetical protein